METSKINSKNQTWKRKIKNVVVRRIHILEWLPHYSKNFALADIIAGITISLTMIPQSIAYAALAELSAEYGLNSAVMGTSVYVFFGTIKEVVIGPSSLMALLTLQYTKGLNVDFVLLLTFLCGLVELAFAIFNLGFLLEFISTPVVSGFTTATSLIIFAAQIKGMFGVQFSTHDFIETFVNLYEKIPDFRLPDFLVGASTFCGLLLLRQLKEIKVKEGTPHKKKIETGLWLITISRNALAVFLGGLVTYLYEKDGSPAPFITTAHVPSGLPVPRLPPLSTQIGNTTYNFPEMVYTLGSGIVLIPIVSILANIAIAKAFTTRTIDTTQEMMTLAMCNIFGSFLQSMPSTGAFTRSAVISASGVRTPLAGLYAALLTLFALQFLTPFFHYIPRASLAAVLMAAVLFMIDYKIFKPLWKTNKFDFFVVIGTTLVCLGFGVVKGLAFGIAVGVAYLVYLWARPKINIETFKNNTNSYVQVTPNKGLYFPAVDYLRDLVIKTGLNHEPYPVVLDCSFFTGTDYTAAMNLKELSKSFTAREQKLIFLNPPPKLVKYWDTLNFQLTYCDTKELEKLIIGTAMNANSSKVTITDDQEKDNESPETEKLIVNGKASD